MTSLLPEQIEEKTRKILYSHFKKHPKERVTSELCQIVDLILQFHQENKVSFNTKSQSYHFDCPHCGEKVEVLKKQLACKIFRHGYYFKKHPKGGIQLLRQIPPHLPKKQCDQLYLEGKIVGCGRPFRILVGKGDVKIEQCPYI